MWRVMARKTKKAERDMLARMELPFLWPDQSGSLNLSITSPGRLSGLLLPHSPRSPRGEVVRASRLMRSRSLLSWLSSRSWGVVGFGVVRQSLFEMWLSAQLENCAFGGMLIREVVREAGELGFLDAGEVIGLVLRCARRGGKFRVEDGMITVRG